MLLVDNARADPFADLRFYLDAFKGPIAESAVVVGVTRVDRRSQPSITAYQTWAAAQGLRLPIMTADARSQDDMRTLIKVLLAILDPSLIR